MGRRWGKTFMAGSYALACADHGAAVAWVVPTYKNARPVWRFAERHTLPVARHLRINRTERTMEFPSGGWLGIFTADNDVSMRGEAFDVVIVDEAARVSEETYSDVILPTLADRDGRALLISTPKGRNWFWQEYQRGISGGARYAAFSAPSNANPMPSIRRAFELARDRVSARTFQQEWCAEFVADGGSVFRGVRALSTLKPTDEGHRFVIGRDWALTNDASVSSVWDLGTREEVFIEMDEDTPFALQISRLKALSERYNNALVVAEQNGLGDPLVEQAAVAGIRIMGFITTNATKAAGVDQLALACERQSVKYQDNERGILEMEAFEASRTPTGLVKYAAPEGLHDDIPLARVFAYSAIADSGPVFLGSE
jgi:hypothetical protein